MPEEPQCVPGALLSVGVLARHVAHGAVQAARLNAGSHRSRVVSSSRRLHRAVGDVAGQHFLS